MKTEIWKDIKGFEGAYQISSMGRVKSLVRKFNKTEKIRAFSTAPNGYLRMVLSFENKRKTISAHREVAKAFIPNPKNKETVNHIDFDKTNNCVENLEWASPQENIQHSCDNDVHFHKPILQKDLKGNIIRKWKSAYSVELELGWFSTNISRCCLGKKKTYKKFKWEFYEQDSI